VALRRKNRVLEMETEILKRASAYLLGRTSSQNDGMSPAEWWGSQ